MIALVLGDTVWSALATLVVVCLALTSLVAEERLPHLSTALGRLVQRPAGRLVLLAGWAELGWHLFCQRP